MIKLTWLIEKIEKKLTIIRLIFGNPLFTPIEKESIQELIEFLSNHIPHLSLHVCFSSTKELTKEEKKKIILEAHSTHLGEKNTIEKSRKIGIWHGMDEDIKRFVQSCPICQLQKTVRIKNQAESIIPDIPLAPSEKISLDIFGPFPITKKGNKYILNIQDRLTRYTVLIPLQDETSNTIVEALLDHYIYSFGAPKNILTDQGTNFLSELVTQFGEASNIKHIKTTLFHPQSNHTS